MRHLSLGLRRVLSGLGFGDGDLDDYLTIVRCWPEFVGAEAARHTSPLRFANGTLFVQADDAAWCSEIRFSAQTILEAANAGLGADRVQEIKVRLGSVRSP